MDISVQIVHDPSVIEGIINFAKSNSIDLIVMGSHGRTGLKKLVLGRVANGVLVKTHCPVLIIKPTEKKWPCRNHQILIDL